MAAPHVHASSSMMMIMVIILILILILSCRAFGILHNYCGTAGMCSMQKKKREEMAGGLIRQWLLVKPMRGKGKGSTMRPMTSFLDVSTVRQTRIKQGRTSHHHHHHPPLPHIIISSTTLSPTTVNWSPP
jgi:hypothetical protein